MARALGALLMVFCIECFLYLFVGKTALTSLFDFALRLSQWSALPFVNILTTTLGTFLVGAGIIAGLYFIRNDFVVYCALSAVTLTFGFDIAELFQFINGSNIFAGGSNIFAIFLCAPLAILYVWTMVSYPGGKDQN